MKSSMRIEAKRFNKYDLILLIGLILILAFSCWKAHFGACGYDEAFYSSIAYKLTRGDALFANEWHGSQMSAMLIYPFAALYTWIFGSCSGIILASRIVYSFIHCAVSAVFYARFRKYGFAAIAAALLYALFFPYNVQCFCYNSIGMDCVFLSCVLAASNESRRLWRYYLSGVFFAAACLCQPLLVCCFLIGGAGVCAYSAIKRAWIVKYALVMALGAASLGALVTAHLLCSVGGQRILAALPGILSDPEHSVSVSLLQKLIRTLKLYMPSVGGDHRMLSVAYFAAAIGVSAAAVIRKIRGRGSRALLTIAALLAVLYDLICARHLADSYINFILFPWIFPGFIAILNRNDRQTVRQYSIFAAFSLAHAISFVTSNQNAHVYNIGAMPLTLFSILLVLDELQTAAARKKKWMCFSIASAAICTFAVMIAARAGYCFWEDVYVGQMRARIDTGAYRGVYTTDLNRDSIQNITDEFYDAGLVDKDNVLIFSRYTCLSLEQRGQTAQYSAWLSGLNEATVERLKQYYDLNPERFPKYAFLVKQDWEKPDDGIRILNSLWADGSTVEITEYPNSYLISVEE